jgi:hypothetical protein
MAEGLGSRSPQASKHGIRKRHRSGRTIGHGSCIQGRVLLSSHEPIDWPMAPQFLRLSPLSLSSTHAHTLFHIHPHIHVFLYMYMYMYMYMYGSAWASTNHFSGFHVEHCNVWHQGKGRGLSSVCVSTPGHPLALVIPLSHTTCSERLRHTVTPGICKEAH